MASIKVKSKEGKSFIYTVTDEQARDIALQYLNTPSGVDLISQCAAEKADRHIQQYHLQQNEKAASIVSDALKSIRKEYEEKSLGGCNAPLPNKGQRLLGVDNESLNIRSTFANIINYVNKLNDVKSLDRDTIIESLINVANKVQGLVIPNSDRG